MRTATLGIALMLLLTMGLVGQEHPSITPTPKLVRVANTFRPANGLAASPVESLTLSVYRDEHGGEALWTETQNVNVDSDGHYAALMGASLPEGLPLDLFASGEARWLGVQFNRTGEVEQPRVLLVSVPYAIKAADAETLGGLPASAYLLSPEAQRTIASNGAPAFRPALGFSKSGKPTPRLASGSAGYIAQFVNATDLGNSAIYQSGSSIGVGTTNPGFAMDFFSAIAGPTAAFRIGNGTTDNRLRVESTQPYALGMKNGFFGTYAWMGVTPTGNYQFSDQNGAPLLTIQQGGNVGIGTTSPASKLDVNGALNVAGPIAFNGALTVSGNQILHMDATNLAMGAHTFENVVTGTFNTAFGAYALNAEMTGVGNTGIGAAALHYGAVGSGNTAVGDSALASNGGGSYNTAVGLKSLYQSTGFDNTAVGAYSLYNNTTGGNNVAIGENAGINHQGSNAIHIANDGVATFDNNVTRIGTTGVHLRFFAAGIRGVTTANNDAIPVVIDSAGQLGTVSSSRRFKENIQDMGDVTSGLMRLRAVIYQYKQPYANGSKPVQYGLIAEEVAAVYPNLVARSADGEIETVKYQDLTPMLLNELQRQHREIERLKEENKELGSLKERMAALEAALSAKAREFAPAGAKPTQPIQ